MEIRFIHNNILLICPFQVNDWNCTLLIWISHFKWRFNYTLGMNSSFLSDTLGSQIAYLKRTIEFRNLRTLKPHLGDHQFVHALTPLFPASWCGVKRGYVGTNQSVILWRSNLERVRLRSSAHPELSLGRMSFLVASLSDITPLGKPHSWSLIWTDQIWTLELLWILKCVV